MRIITERAIKEYWEKHPNAESSLTNWLNTAKLAKWKNIQEVRASYPHADLATVESKNTVTIFNINGNHHRLITSIHYNTQIIYILALLSPSSRTQITTKTTGRKTYEHRHPSQSP